VRPSVVVLQPNNFVSQGEGLVGELLALAGFRNHASVIGVGPSGRVEIETLIAHPPDVLILANAPGDYATVVADNLRHPALAALVARLPSAVVPWSGWLCGTHHIAGVLDQLGALRRRAIAAGGARD
jgi:iron complex transport system substrate-binding protein